MRSVDSFVKGLRGAIEESARQDPTHPTVRRKLRTVIAQCGWARRSPERIAELDKALVGEGIHCSPKIRDDDLRLDDFVRFSTRSFVDPGHLFSNEKEFERQLSQNPSAISRVLREYGRLTLECGGVKGQRSYLLEGARLFPDLVFRTQAGPRLVVELKQDSGLGDVPQLVRYMRAVAREMGGEVHGLLITAHPTVAGMYRELQRMIDSQSGSRTVHWLVYNLNLRLGKPLEPGLAPNVSRKEVTLHGELVAILTKLGGGWHSTEALASLVNSRGIYRRRDGSEVDARQIHGRTRNYPHLFERDGNRVRLLR